MEFATCPLIVTDGFEFYGTVIRRVFGPAALYAQAIKTRRHDRVVRVERRAVMGAAWRFDDALTHSEDSSTLNTSFIPRLLTITEVAELLRTTQKAVYAMAARGQLPGVIRLGRRVLVRADVLVDYLDQKRTPSLEE